MVSRLRCFIGGILFCFFSSSFALHATENDDLVKAMMEVYAEELAANPQDYRTYYSRAMAYFGQGDMKKALSDIDNAIKYFPRKEKDDLAQAYLLRAKILSERGETKSALTDLNSALRFVAHGYPQSKRIYGVGASRGSYRPAGESERFISSGCQSLAQRSEDLFGAQRDL